MNDHWKGTPVESLPIGSGRVGGVPNGIAPWMRAETIE